MIFKEFYLRFTGSTGKVGVCGGFVAYCIFDLSFILKDNISNIKLVDKNMNLCRNRF